MSEFESWRRIYAGFTDHELVALADKPQSLRQPAIEALRAELDRRIGNSNMRPVFQGDNGWYDVRVHRNQILFPAACAHCLSSTADIDIPFESNYHTQYEIIRLTHRYLKVPIPMCRHCAETFRKKRRYQAIWIGTAVVVSLAVDEVSGGGRYWGLCVVLLLCLPLFWLFKETERFRVGDFSEQFVIIGFRSLSYATDFARINKAAFANQPPDLKAALENLNRKISLGMS